MRVVGIVLERKKMMTRNKTRKMREEVAERDDRKQSRRRKRGKNDMTRGHKGGTEVEEDK